MATIGKYQVLEQVGEGAMGVVYKAHDPVLNRTVAVKVMSVGLAQDEVLRERFLREAQAAGSLQHPNLVTIYDFGEMEGHLYIAMEFIEGADLEKLMLKQVQLDLPMKLDIVIDVLNGLSFAHRRGVIHRDIKPANIRIDQEGRARIMDFGVAKMSSSNLTGTGIMMGTPNYMAPEQITGEKTLGPAADLWAVGAVLYELLTNQRPFEADTLHRVLFKIVSDDPPPLREAAPGVPVALDEIVQTALAKEADQRYRSATEMANALSAVRVQLSAAPRTTRTLLQRASIEVDVPRLTEKVSKTIVPAAQSVAATPAATPAGMATVPPTRPNWGLIGGGVVVLLIAVGGVSYLGSRAGRGAEQKVEAPAVQAPTVQVPQPPPTQPPPAQEPPAQTQATAPAPQTPDVAVSQRTSPPAPRTNQRRTDSGQVTASNPPAPVTSPAATSQGAPASQPQTQTQAPPPVANAPAPTQQIVSSPPPTVVAPPPATTTTPAPAPENPRPAIEAILADYARSIGTRQVAEVKRVYPGMTPQQQSGWEGFFSSARSMTATLDISSLNIGAGSAVARVTGAYEFVTRAGRTERQPASFEATFAKQGDAWVLQRIR